MELLEEYKNDDVNLKFFAGCDTSEMVAFDEASKDSKDVTFMVVFAKSNELNKNGDKIPNSDYIVIYEVPDKMDNYEKMINVIKKYYDKVSLDDLPWIITPE